MATARRFIDLKEHQYQQIVWLIRAVGFLMNKLYVVLAVVIVVVALLGVAYFAFGSHSGILAQMRSSGPVVSNGDMVTVYYTGTFTNGTEFGTNVGGQPLQFTVGSNDVISGFQAGIVGMGLNQTKNITVPANEAYGEVNPALIVNVPLSAFGNSIVNKGMEVSENTSSGVASGLVTAVNKTAATIDFNPPLAGKTLKFSIKVVGIQKPQT